jgi:hypothetical protein
MLFSRREIFIYVSKNGITKYILCIYHVRRVLGMAHSLGQVIYARVADNSKKYGR